MSLAGQTIHRYNTKSTNYKTKKINGTDYVKM